jgi:DNA-binding NarL/FixJ family response regulator
MHIIRTVIADDHPIFVEGLKQVLLSNFDFRFKITALATDGRSALHQLKHKKSETDLLILDLNLPELDGFEVLEALGADRQHIRVLILSMYEDPKLIKEAFKVGVDGYLLKTQVVEELFVGIREIMEGNRYIGKGVMLYSSEEDGHTGASAPPHTDIFEDKFIRKYHLTKREMEILHLITRAKSNKEIGLQLFISDQTVSVHRKNIMRKLGVSNTAALIKVAYENSLL